MSDIGKILGEFYRPSYEERFKDHPDKDRIVEALVTGNYESTEQVDKWFDEAEALSWKRVLEAGKNALEENNTVTFDYWKAHGS